MFIELAALAATLFVVYYLFFEFREDNLPPGPTPLPFIGSLHLRTKRGMHVDLTELDKKYGKIYRLYFGHRPVVVLSGDAIKEALVRQPKIFAGRPTLRGSMKEAFPDGPGLPMMDHGDAWKVFRKLGHQAIKVYGEDRLQEVIKKEVAELCKRLEATNGEAIDITKQLGTAVTNVICTKIFGSRYEIDDPEFIKVYEIHEALTRIPFGSDALRSNLPFLKPIIPLSKAIQKAKGLAEERYILIRDKLHRHQETFDPENIRDYTDALLKAKQEAEEEDKSNKQHLHEKNIIMAGLATLFIAGSETTSTTLGWAVVYILNNPGLQERLHKEIDEVVGREEFPQLSQRKQLPLIEAFTAETLRMANLAPLAIPHKTTTSSNLLGYNIPEGTMVMTNIWSLHHDPAIWEDPFKFKLERFLDEEGKFKSPPGGTFLPFGAGPRVCLGEVLARSELFLFLSRLLQKFKFVNPSGCGMPSMDGDLGGVLHPMPFTVCVQRRA